MPINVAYYYQMTPTSMIAKERVFGRKKAKAQATLLICANFDGFENLDVMIIGSAFQLRTYKKKLVRDLELTITPTSGLE